MHSTSPQPTSPSPLLADSRRHLGPYELIGEIGRGGMGRVFLARRVGQAGFERLFAVKVVLDDLSGEQEALFMLFDEARIASKIHHPNVVPIIDIGVDDDRHFLVMDYVDGCSLSELLRSTTERRPTRLVVPLLIDALRGLHAAHELLGPDGRSLELVHRDFSPPNLLIGVDGTCRVTDFGVVKARARLTQTRPAIQKGKISYMAPEQLSADANLDRRVDIWAAGVVLFYALTGEHPFRGRSHATTVHAILEREVPRPSTVGFQPPPCFDRICLRALERDRDRRYATAAEMADDLLRVAARRELLGSQTEISAWVGDVFAKQLAMRRRVVEAMTQSPTSVEWIRAPVLPGPDRSGVTGPSDSTPAIASSSSSTKVTARPHRPGLSARRRRRRTLRLLAAVAMSAAFGFIVTSLLLPRLIDLLTSTPEPLQPPATRAASTAPPPRDDSDAPGTSPATNNEPPLAKSLGDAAAVAPKRQEPPSGAPAAATPPRRIRVTLVGLPRRAVIRLDGNRVAGTTIRLPADRRRHRLVVEAPGRETWRHVFRATRSFEIEPALKRSRRRPRRDRR